MEAAIRKGRKLPDWYLSEPLKYDVDTFYLDAFWDLDTERLFENGPIPESRITDYAYRMHLPESMHNAFRIVIRALDRAKDEWLEEIRPKGKRGPFGRQERER